MTPEDLTPGYVPKRFARRRAQSGETVRALSGQGTRTVVSHFDAADPRRPVEVGGSDDPAARLVGTEGRDGARVDLGVPNATAVYHDGQWAPGPGRDQVDNGEVVIHWDTESCHSITAAVPAGLVTVRAPRTVDLEGLLKIARSIPAVARA